ncbi:MAG TPA: hypothetical protein VG603_11080 [Chitinophagales bacterium]|nr:hypothetical protein [Chitinophagales bacterium]
MNHFYVWRMKALQVLGLLLFFVTGIYAQTDSLKAEKPAHTFTHRDTVYLEKLNTSGNLMIAGGVGLCGVGAYLIYEGVKTYNTPAAPNSTDPASDVQRNQKQGTLYLAFGGISIAGGIVLGAFGVRNKLDFKTRKRWMELQSGVLDSGALGLALNF